MLANANLLSNFFDRLGGRLRGGFILFLDGEVDFFAVDAGLTRCFDPQTDLAALDGDDHDFDVVVDGDCFAELTGQYQHHITVRYVPENPLSATRYLEGNIICVVSLALFRSSWPEEIAALTTV